MFFRRRAAVSKRQFRKRLDDAQPIVFIHIFKSAGTTFQVEMREALGVAAAPKVNDGWEEPGGGFFDRVAAACSQPDTKMLCGHAQYTRYAAAYESCGLKQPLAISFVRDPIERFVSMYNYFRTKNVEKWHREAATLSIGEFLHFIVENDLESIENHQCRNLSGSRQSTFEAAKDNIAKNFVYFGTMQNISLVNPTLHQLWGITLNSRTRLNVSEKNARKDDLAQSDLKTLQEITEEDRKLFEFALRQEAKK